MNYQHTDHMGTSRVSGDVTSAARRKKAADAERVEQLNRLTRYPSLVATAATGVALLAAVIHLIR